MARYQILRNGREVSSRSIAQLLLGAVVFNRLMIWKEGVNSPLLKRTDYTTGDEEIIKRTLARLKTGTEKSNMRFSLKREKLPEVHCERVIACPFFAKTYVGKDEVNFKKLFSKFLFSSIV